MKLVLITEMSKLVPVGLSLTATACWGTAGFLGGYGSRRKNSFVFATVVNLAALTLVFVTATSVGAPVLSRHSVIWSLIAGICGGLGLAIFYGSLSRGKMGLAAPVVGVISVGIPTVATILREGSPGSPHLLGFALAIVGVFLISQSGDRTERQVFMLAILAGCGFAGYAMAIRQAGPGSAIWIEVHSRASALLITLVVAVCGSHFGELRRSSPWLGIGVGIIDVAGSVAFVRDTQIARLDTVIVLTSLQPAVTVVLALILLKEKLAPYKAIGVCAALLSIPLIAN